MKFKKKKDNDKAISLKYVCFQFPSEYKRLYDDTRGHEYSKYHGYAFDGVWTIAKAMDTLLKGKDPHSLSDDIFRGQNVSSALNETDFRGVTVRVGINLFQNVSFAQA